MREEMESLMGNRIDCQPSIEMTFKNLDSEESKALPKWKDFFFVIWDMDQYLRGQLKYNDELSKEADEALDKAREELWNIMSNHNVSLEDLS